MSAVGQKLTSILARRTSAVGGWPTDQRFFFSVTNRWGTVTRRCSANRDLLGDGLAPMRALKLPPFQDLLDFIQTELFSRDKLTAACMLPIGSVVRFHVGLSLKKSPVLPSGLQYSVFSTG